MSSVKYLREFVNERLTAAAEEIFGVFEKTIVLYAEEIDRQRRLLDFVWKPEIKLHRIELPQQHVYKEEEALSDQQLCIQESLDQEDPDLPQIKEEEEELCTSQGVEQFIVKQETDDFMLTPTHEESDHSEDQTMNMSSDESQGAEEEAPLSFMSVRSLLVSEPNINHQLLCHSSHEAEIQDQKGGKRGGSRSARAAERKPKRRRYRSRDHTYNLKNPKLSDIKIKKPFLCDACGKEFSFNSHYQRHRRVHTGERPFPCRICDKVFTRRDILTVHMRTHTDKKRHSRKMVSWKTIWEATQARSGMKTSNMAVNCQST